MNEDVRWNAAADEAAVAVFAESLLALAASPEVVAGVRLVITNGALLHLARHFPRSRSCCRTSIMPRFRSLRLRSLWSLRLRSCSSSITPGRGSRLLCISSSCPLMYEGRCSRTRSRLWPDSIILPSHGFICEHLVGLCDQLETLGSSFSLLLWDFVRMACECNFAEALLDFCRRRSACNAKDLIEIVSLPTLYSFPLFGHRSGNG
mmetsp:Transcript_97166/g.168480  ORF Transcript_97166/g.168480 Transcript_97166/m.168480 type:complete len:206 (+) Transcript_97166:961-1578(+)